MPVHQAFRQPVHQAARRSEVGRGPEAAQEAQPPPLFAPVCAPTAAAHSSHQQHLAHLRVELVVILHLLHQQKRSSLCGQIACLPDGGTNLHTQLGRTGEGRDDRQRE